MFKYGIDRCSEFLSSGNWIHPADVEVVIDSIPKYQRLAPEIKRDRDNGASVNAIASARGLTWEFVTQALHYADTGERPRWKPSGGKRPQNAAPPKDTRKFPKYAELVRRLRDEEHMTFAKIRAYVLEHLGEQVGDGTLRRAYDYAQPANVREAVKNGTRVLRSSAILIGKATCDQIEKLSLEKPEMTNAEIAQAVGTSPSSVARVRRGIVGKRPGGKRPKPK